MDNALKLLNTCESPRFRNIEGVVRVKPLNLFGYKTMICKSIFFMYFKNFNIKLLFSIVEPCDKKKNSAFTNDVVVQGYGCPGLSVVGSAIAIAEIARVDTSCSSFMLVHTSLAMLTIGMLHFLSHLNESCPECNLLTHSFAKSHAHVC